MGWFGEGILDGDAPMDIEARFAERLGLSQGQDVYELYGLNESSGKLARDNWDWAKMMNAARQQKGNEVVGFQVLAAWAMAAGVPINGAQKIRLRAEIEADESEAWIAEENRRAEINRLLKALEQYDGTPLLWDSLPLELTEKQWQARHKFGVDLLNNAWALTDLEITAAEVAAALEDMPDNQMAKLDRALGGLFSRIAKVKGQPDQIKEEGDNYD